MEWEDDLSIMMKEGNIYTIDWLRKLKNNNSFGMTFKLHKDVIEKFIEAYKSFET